MWPQIKWEEVTQESEEVLRDLCRAGFVANCSKSQLVLSDMV